VNIQEYIESGVLELYAMGALPPAEMKEVEELAEAHPEVRAEIRAIEEALGELAAAVARAPRPGLKEEILGRIAGPEGAIATATAPIIPIGSPPSPEASAPMPVPVTAAAPARPRSYLLAASVLVGLLGIGLALYYGSRLAETERELATAIRQRDAVATTANEMRDRLKRVETDMVVLRDPEFRTVMMKGTKNAPSAMSVVHWHPASRQVFLDVKAMPPPPSGHQYQLWALTETGPVDAGMFDGTSDTVIMRPMKSVETAHAFAVTVEPMGGSPAPTLETMVVSGTL
jgi:anti-sigma-K factor RskA